MSLVFFWIDDEGKKHDGPPSRVSGDLSGVYGDLSGVYGDLDDAEITDVEREAGINIKDLVIPDMTKC